MSENTEHNHYETDGLSANQELSQLIGAVMAAKQSAMTHPAKAVLEALEANVETQAREMARHEIDTIASQIHLAAGSAHQAEAPVAEDAAPASSTMPEANLAPESPVTGINPFAPQAPAPAPVSWISDAMKANSARMASTSWASHAPVITQYDDQEAVVEAVPAKADITDIKLRDADISEEDLAIPPFGYHAPTDSFEPETVEVGWEEDVYERPEDARLVAPALANGDNGWFGHSEDGLPMWMTAGIPVAAVSLFALGFAFMDHSDTPALTPASGALSQTSVQSASLPAPALEPATPDIAEAIPANIAPDQPVQIVPVSQAQIVRPAASSIIVKTPVEVEEAGSVPAASVPSLKPAYPKIAQSNIVAQTAAKAPAGTSFAPRRALPVRMFTGRIEAGSAAAMATAAVEQNGTVLADAEKAWLARDMERALDNEIDGRSVSLKARSGERVRVALKTSQQVQRSYTISRANEMGSLPHNIVLEGGWYAAKRDLFLHATPSLSAGMRHRTVKQDALIERMGTYTDRYGDRWYLMGQRGLAVGFLSAADVVLAEIHDRPVGDVYYAAPGARVSETRVVYTKCRDGFVGPEGGLSSRLQVCRDAQGHWIKHTQGKVAVRQASLLNTLTPKTDTASAIVLAEATGDPVTYHAFGNRMFRRRLQGDFVYARFGQTTEQTLPNGDPIRFTFGEAYEVEGKTPVIRVAALGTLPSIRIHAGFMKAPIGAKVRAMPDLLSVADLGEIPAGRAVETIGLVEGLRGEDWMLIGRSGVGFGYVPAAKLTAIEGRVSPYAIKNVRQSATVAELVDATHLCRSVTYETLAGTGAFDACQQADGSWLPRPVPGRQFAQSAISDTPVAP